MVEFGEKVLVKIMDRDGREVATTSAHLSRSIKQEEKSMKIYFFYSDTSILKDFMIRQLEEAKKEINFKVYSVEIGINPMLVDHYHIVNNPTLIIFNEDKSRSFRIERPISSDQLIEVFRVLKNVWGK